MKQLIKDVKRVAKDKSIEFVLTSVAGISIIPLFRVLSDELKALSINNLWLVILTIAVFFAALSIAISLPKSKSSQLRSSFIFILVTVLFYLGIERFLLFYRNQWEVIGILSIKSKKIPGFEDLSYSELIDSFGGKKNQAFDYISTIDVSLHILLFIWIVVFVLFANNMIYTFRKHYRGR